MAGPVGLASLGHDLSCLAILTIRAADLLGACGFLARLCLDRAFDLLHHALDLVLDAGLSLVVCVWSARLGHSRFFGGGAGLALLGDASAGAGGGLALSRRFGGNGGKDSGLGVAGCTTGLGHFGVEWFEGGRNLAGSERLRW